MGKLTLLVVLLGVFIIFQIVLIWVNGVSEASVKQWILIITLTIVEFLLAKRLCKSQP